MYSQGFIQTLTNNATGQPEWLASSIKWGAHLAQHNLTLWNTLFALTQAFIGFGLLHRRTVKAALAASIAWSLIVWWFGEALGMLFTSAANPLTGAPGPGLLYAIVGLLAWPTGRAGGLLGMRGARTAWTVLWLAMGWLWLIPANSSANATRTAIDTAPSGMRWVSSLQNGVASAAKGNGLVIALILALASAAIGVAVGINWRPKPFLALAIILSLAYWVIGQGFGGIFTGSATDPGVGPPFLLLAIALFARSPVQQPMVAPGSRPATAASLHAHRGRMASSIVHSSLFTRSASKTHG
jgi:hypothetical protein